MTPVDGLFVAQCTSVPQREADLALNGTRGALPLEDLGTLSGVALNVSYTQSHMIRTLRASGGRATQELSKYGVAYIWHQWVHLASCSGDRTVRVWDMANGECRATLEVSAWYGSGVMEGMSRGCCTHTVSLCGDEAYAYD